MAGTLSGLAGTVGGPQGGPAPVKRPGPPEGPATLEGPALGEPQEVQSWSRPHVGLDQVVAALPELRRKSAGRDTGTRTAVMTVVMVSDGSQESKAAADSVRSIGARHPCRAIFLEPDPDSTPAIDAKACLWRAEPSRGEGNPVFFEELSMRIGGQAASHLASIVGPFVLADLPVVIWFPGQVPNPADPLLRLASTIVVDTRTVADLPGSLSHSYRTLLELANRCPVVDLSWVRLQPWRELLAGLFEPEHNRPFLSGVRLASVEGKAGPRHILGGWLMAQLDLRARELKLSDAQHVDIRLEATAAGEEGTFQVMRDGQARAVWAKATFSGGISHAQGLPLPDDSLTSALAAAVSNLQADRVWERALSSAAGLAA